jgi:galactokinase/mevalonate kinase-like predicted kinase
LNRQGVFGKKLLGSGGSGFMLVVCDKKKKSSIVKDIKKTNKILNFNIDFEGCKKIFAD